MLLLYLYIAPSQTFLPSTKSSVTCPVSRVKPTYQQNSTLPTAPQPSRQNPLQDENMPYTRRSHANGHARPNGLCIHVITYGRSRGHAQIPMPKLVHVDCVQTEPPLLHLREKYTGVDRELADHYWSNPLHESLFQRTLDQLEVRILNGPFQRGGCAAVVVNCVSGTYKDILLP